LSAQNYGKFCFYFIYPVYQKCVTYPVLDTPVSIVLCEIAWLFTENMSNYAVSI